MYRLRCCVFQYFVCVFPFFKCSRDRDRKLLSRVKRLNAFYVFQEKKEIEGPTVLCKWGSEKFATNFSSLCYFTFCAVLNYSTFLACTCAYSTPSTPASLFHSIVNPPFTLFFHFTLSISATFHSFHFHNFFWNVERRCFVYVVCAFFNKTRRG